MNPLTEEFELIYLLGKPCLFTSLRVKRADLPEGLYKYDLREGERNFFGSLEYGVLINHMGTVISKEPFDLGDAGYVELEDETQPNFMSVVMTIDEYLAIAPEMIRCAHCAYLVEDDEGRWVCDDWGKDIRDVPDEDCAAEQGGGLSEDVEGFENETDAD